MNGLKKRRSWAEEVDWLKKMRNLFVFAAFEVQDSPNRGGATQRPIKLGTVLSLRICNEPQGALNPFPSV